VKEPVWQGRSTAVRQTVALLADFLPPLLIGLAELPAFQFDALPVIRLLASALCCPRQWTSPCTRD